MTLGKSINLYLMDDISDGRWQAQLTLWSATAYKIPRAMLAECGDMDCIHTPGVYLLFGKSDTTDKQFVYVGEAEDSLKRIAQPHSFEKHGYYWSAAIVFIATDGSLDKSKVKYLEKPSAYNCSRK